MPSLLFDLQRPLEAEGEINPSGSEQDVDLSPANGGAYSDGINPSDKTKTINGSLYLRVKSLGRLTVRAATTGTDSTLTVYGRVTRSSSEETLNSKTLTGTEESDVIRNLDILDVSWVRVSENGASGSQNTVSVFVLAA